MGEPPLPTGVRVMDSNLAVQLNPYVLKMRGGASTTVIGQFKSALETQWVVGVVVN